MNPEQSCIATASNIFRKINQVTEFRNPSTKAKHMLLIQKLFLRNYKSYLLINICLNSTQLEYPLHYNQYLNSLTPTLHRLRVLAARHSFFCVAP
uniref:Uncharacterized protein n=1 Tax=Arundo donax TaxID=35708 RepID=A0A0A9BPN7_ARUDO